MLPTIIYDGSLDIATGRSRQETNWKNKGTTWSDLLTRLSATHRTAESYAEYLASKKSRQDEIKDVGGFVGGYLSGGRRGKGSVNYRQLVTLDVDFGTKGIWDDLVLYYGCAAAVYSTHKHGPDKPRLRLIIPLDRHVLCDEYTAIARRIAGTLGIEYFDVTTYQPERLMYWPSSSKDGEYVFEYQDGPWLSADEVLATYRDWTDSSEWPVSDREGTVVQGQIKKQGDPLEKQGVVGAYCRTYTIHDVIANHLSDVYTQCDIDDRYTYVEGSTAAGLVTYEDKYAYSHHGTDPTSMKLCNAFDLVRIHKYGLKDEGVTAGTPGNRLPSYNAMVEFVRKDPKVRKLLGAEKLQEALSDFEGVELDEETTDEASSDDWLAELDVDKKGNYRNSMDNIVKVLEHDPRLKGRIILNVFEQREAVKKNLPWRKVGKDSAYLNDRDVSNLRHYLEKTYDLSSAPKVEDALKVILEKNQFHPIKDYLNSLQWDGISRIDTMLTEYLGVEDSEYSRTIMRKTLAAAVSRIFNPGCKFDYVLTFVGAQGLKKSTLIDKLGGAWFSDSFTTVQGKEAYEQLQGSWLIEIAELAGMRKAEIETIKHFITKRRDRYRVAYGRRVEEFPRQCIFFATTNTVAFLKDATGNRRWWPVMVHTVPPAKDVSTDLTQAEVDQIWAEAVLLYKNREPLYLSPEMEAEAAKMQEEHTEVDERTGIVQKYLDTLLPENWEELGVFDRRAWLAGDELQAGGTVVRNRVSVAEIYCEALRGKQEDMNTNNTKDIHSLMRNMKGWEPTKNRVRFGHYGTQKGYIRSKNSVTTKSEKGKNVTTNELD